MTVKQFLSSYNIGRSAIHQATVVDTGVNTEKSGEAYTYSKIEMVENAYGKRFGDLKVTTFTITDEKIIIYAK